ncbi:MAG: hypothetical protein V3U76_06910 [Granulosicoccus sp.]
MEEILSQRATVVAISAAGIFFTTGLLTGVWKYMCMSSSDEFQAPYYVDIAHRAALLYSFAGMLIAVFAFFSPFPDWVTVPATIAPLLFLLLQ